MISKSNFLAALAVTALLAACASKPTTIPNISSSTNPTTEIERTERMINEARQNQVDVLSPTNFTEAEKSLAKAKKLQEKNKSSENVLEEVAYSQGFLMDAKAKADISRASMKEITDARADAQAANAPQLLPKEWSKAGRELEDITKRIEKGDLSRANKQGNNLTARYRELEIMAVRKANLGIADENIQAAKKDNADKKAPKTFSAANMKFDNAAKLIAENPKNTEIIRRASEAATKESVHLAEVMRRVNAGNSEDLVLMAERQQKTISTLRSDYSSTEEELAHSQRQLDQQAREKTALTNQKQELEKTQETLKTAEAIRRQFKPSEAEVFVDSGKVMIRLKALQFPSSQAALGPKNQAFLKKVETALQDVNASKITVEGHTDATGNADKNMVLSEQRAQAVEKYLSANGIPAQEIQSVGRGSENPISDNSSAKGRAENRRIDLVIETQ